MHPRMIFDTFSPEFPRRTAARHQHLSEFPASRVLTIGHVPLFQNCSHRDGLGEQEEKEREGALRGDI